MNKDRKWPEVWPGYETVEKLGTGSYGTVWKVRKTDASGEYYSAVKKISIPSNESEYYSLRDSGRNDDEITATFRKRLEEIENEFRIMKDLMGNSHIVSYQEHMVVEKEYDDYKGSDVFILMELLIPLSKCYPHFSEKEVCKLGIHICSALETIQKMGIVHRDIKPSNILYNNKQELYKLSDFGIARVMEHTTAGTVIGTPDYIAPEVDHKKPYGKQADQYSLGLVLYWALNKMRLPFEPTDHVPAYEESQSARQRRLNGETLPEPLHGSRKLRDAVLKACAPGPEDRFRDITVLKKTLEECESQADDRPFIESDSHGDRNNSAGGGENSPETDVCDDKSGQGTLGHFSEKHKKTDPDGSAEDDVRDIHDVSLESGGTIGKFSLNDTQTDEDGKGPSSENLPSDGPENDEEALDLNKNRKTEENEGSDKPGDDRYDTDGKKPDPGPHDRKMLLIGGLIVLALLLLVSLIRGCSGGTSGTAAKTTAAKSGSVSAASASSDSGSINFKHTIGETEQTKAETNTAAEETDSLLPSSEEETLNNAVKEEEALPDDPEDYQTRLEKWMPVLTAVDDMFTYNGKHLKELSLLDIVERFKSKGIDYYTQSNGENTSFKITEGDWWIADTRRYSSGAVTMMYINGADFKASWGYSRDTDPDTTAERIHALLPDSCPFRIGDSFESVCKTLGADDEMIASLLAGDRIGNLSMFYSDPSEDTMSVEISEGLPDDGLYFLYVFNADYHYGFRFDHQEKLLDLITVHAKAESLADSDTVETGSNEWADVINSIDEFFLFGSKHIRDLDKTDITAALDAMGASYIDLPKDAGWWIGDQKPANVLFTADSKGLTNASWNDFELKIPVEDMNAYLPASCPVKIGDPFEEVCRKLGFSDEMTDQIMTASYGTGNNNAVFTYPDPDTEKKLRVSVTKRNAMTKSFNVDIDNNNYGYTFSFNYELGDSLQIIDIAERENW